MDGALRAAADVQLASTHPDNQRSRAHKLTSRVTQVADTARQDPDNAVAMLRRNAEHTRAALGISHPESDHR